jgi:hypothetical protein
MKLFSTDKLYSLSLAGLVFLFFAFLYPFHLNYQEQYQMFLFTGDYFFGFLAKPGGFSDYIGNFFTQFFFYSWVGAIIIASLLTLLQRLVFSISKTLVAKSLFVPLTFIPSILYWGLLLDENYLLGGVVVMLLVATFIFVYTLLKQITSRAIFVLISIPILYWLAGGTFLLLPLFAIALEITTHEMKKSHLFSFAVGCMILSLTVPIFCKYSFLQYPMSRVWLGANFYRFPIISPFSVGLIGLLIIVIPFVLRFLTNRFKPKSPVFILALQISVLLIGGYLLIGQMSDMKKEELMAYDFNVRMRKWDRVIKLADKKAPSSPLSVTCLNLALAKEGLLSERMFYYYQNGVEGLLPDFTRDFTIPMIAGEVYYHLGFINTAQRYAFEAMEALPDYQKSVRSVMRLAETNLINGNYAVAEKYLFLLQKTFYYRLWATNALKTMKDENKITQHPEWGKLRQFRTREDFLFSEGEKDMMLGVLFSQNKENKMAYEYLMAYCLLTKDLKHFMQYIPLGRTLNYKAIPNSYQEALMYVWEKTNTDPTKEIPYQVTPFIQSRVKSFERLNSSQNNGDPKLFAEFSNTYWYYLQFRK